MRNVVISVVFLAVGLIVGNLYDKNQQLKESNNILLEENLCLKTELEEVKCIRHK
jgi:hypothetical protein